MAKIVGVVLIVLGVAALVWGGFTYTKESHDAKLGPIEFSLKDKERIAVPTWASVAAVGVGAALLLVGRRR